MATLNGATIAVAVGASGVTLNGDTKVVVADIITTKGVIHLIDKGLLPPAGN